jgi:RNA polymerase sigma-70 factor (ECF subfamily)
MARGGSFPSPDGPPERGPSLPFRPGMAFREIYQAYFSFVWRSLRRLGVADANAKDAAQEVFLVVHRRLPDFVERAKVTTWLFRICLHVAKDDRRRAHVRHEILDDSAFEAHADPSPGAADGAERREALATFEAALSRLHLEQRAVFILFELEDMTGEQIAELLRIPLGTVYSRLRLARAAFRKGLLQRGERAPGRVRLVGTR